MVIVLFRLLVIGSRFWWWLSIIDSCDQLSFALGARLNSCAGVGFPHKRPLFISVLCCCGGSDYTQPQPLSKEPWTQSSHKKGTPEETARSNETTSQGKPKDQHAEMRLLHRIAKISWSSSQRKRHTHRFRKDSRDPYYAKSTDSKNTRPPKKGVWQSTGASRKWGCTWKDTTLSSLRTTKL